MSYYFREGREDTEERDAYRDALRDGPRCPMCNGTYYLNTTQIQHGIGCSQAPRKRASKETLA